MLTGALAFVLFALDKGQARRGGRRISEFHLVVIGALGGWPGGALAMLLCRHKTAKASFLVRYAAGFFVWAGLIYLWLTRRPVGKSPGCRSIRIDCSASGRRESLRVLRASAVE